MGEPIPGDIADPVRLSTTNVKIKGGIIGFKGDYLVKDGGNDFFTLADTTSVGPILAAVTDVGFVQAQEDFDSTGIADGVVTVAAFDFQARVYAFVAAALNPGELVELAVLVDDSPGPAIVGFAPISTGEKVGRYIKLSGDNPVGVSTANAVAIVDLGAAS